MIRLSRPLHPRRRESTIALINIVFLMLIFFLIAGTVAPLDHDVRLISTETADRAELADALFVTPDGEMRVGGRATDPAAYVEALKAEGSDGDAPVKVAADRDLPAERLIDVVAALRKAGADKVSIVTERSAE
ncbi:ExbD/TolR family protein [Chelativorans sp. YIM 93263]|uniref:ExbD/TolR family protein n=1 Tax=Chelativorans sp. YIM 93263 TaxID=2906648 RepID=UPI0023786A51|nr:biopolymer transporter ExbD [Chelativorans sp. YIM 93263]